jgi:hypothetical protein
MNKYNNIYYKMNKTFKNKSSAKNKTRKMHKMTGGININLFSKYINQDNLPFMYFYNLNDMPEETKTDEESDEYDELIGEEY